MKYFLHFIVAWWKSLPEISEGVKIKSGPGFKKKRKRKKDEEPTEIDLHESVTHTWKGAHRVLNTRGLSVHYTIAKDGTIRQHADPIKYYCLHAGGKHNKNSVAIEIINRYYGKKGAEGVIKAVWAHKKYYRLPTRAQCESTWKLLHWLDIQFDTNLLQWPSVKVSGNRFKWGRMKEIELDPGVKAHHRWHHADALFIEHCTLIRHLGYSKDIAYDLTVTHASSGDRITDLPPEVER